MDKLLAVYWDEANELVQIHAHDRLTLEQVKEMLVMLVKLVDSGTDYEMRPLDQPEDEEQEH